MKTFLVKTFLVKTFLLFLSALWLCAAAQAATWHYKLSVAAGPATPKVEVCPLKYGKTWAYAFQQDDGPLTTLTVSQPLLARYEWNDAPPGVTGGKNHAFAGTAAVIVGSVGRNEASLSFAQIAALQEKGWGISNHSYWHSGVWWDPAGANKPEDYRRELFWSQTVYAELIGGGRAASDFVLPNGDPGYIPYLTAYGVRSSSRVGGASAPNVLAPNYNPLDLSRSYLDEAVWVKSNNPLQDLLPTPHLGDFFVDFTHNIEAAPSANNTRWRARLNYIAQTWGPQGDNSMWVAPTNEVATYALAARAAKITLKADNLSVELPDTVAGSALTLKISGLNPQTVLLLSPGATLYRQGETAWLTTPVIGRVGVPSPTPHVHRIYLGEVKNLTWEKPVVLAGVRFRRDAALPEGFVLKIEAQTPRDGIQNIATVGKTQLEKVWGSVLYSLLPDHPAILANALHVTGAKGLTQMEVWAVEDTPNTP